MSNKKISSIEWLIEQIDNKDMGEVPMWIYDFCEQAKEMHKQEIVDSRTTSPMTSGDVMLDRAEAEQYYNQTFDVT